MSEEPRAYTSEEVRDEFLDCIRSAVDFWEKEDRETVREKLDGLVFSILNILDGTTDFPAITLSLNPHPDDKQYHIDNGENWYEPGTEIHGGGHLHDEY